jgi:hypothetical protein
MPTNYILLEKITVGAAGASSVTFSNIPQTGYTDLILQLSTRSTSNGGYTYVSFNGSTTSYSTKDLVNSNGSVLSASYALPGGVSWFPQSSYTASTFSNSEVYIPNYTSANFKSFSLFSTAENNSTTYVSGIEAALWSNTAAITSITCTPNTANYAQHSTFYLYGVAALGTVPLISPYATGGDIIDTDGTYWYHTFLSSGTFTPVKAITCDYLVVAGGGGGGSRNNAGGGGGGGFRCTVTATGGGGSLETPLSLASGTGYTVTIGAGGASTTAYNTQGGAGSNSVFSTITSTGGGGGGGEDSNGGNGGSSGGGGYNGSAGTRTASPVQGYNGAAGSLSGIPYPAGGGGGAGQAGGGDLSLAQRAQGGNGQTTSISGSSVTYGGGGSGGRENASFPGLAGGTGGGGSGGNKTIPNLATAGTANRGGGGGGNSTTASASSGAGGSGIVIVRYAV